MYLIESITDDSVTAYFCGPPYVL